MITLPSIGQRVVDIAGNVGRVVGHSVIDLRGSEGFEEPDNSPPRVIALVDYSTYGRPAVHLPELGMYVSILAVAIDSLEPAPIL